MGATQGATCNDVDDVSTGEIKDAPFRKEALSPMPLDNWAVDPAVPEEEEDEHRRELHALSKRPRGDDSAAHANKESEGVQGFGLKANNKQSKESKTNKHGQNVDKRRVRNGHETETHVTMAKVIWNLHATTNRTASVDRTCAAGNVTAQASIQGNEKPYMMWTLVGMVPSWELGFNLVVSVFASEVVYGP